VPTVVPRALIQGLAFPWKREKFLDFGLFSYEKASGSETLRPNMVGASFCQDPVVGSALFAISLALSSQIDYAA